MLRAVAAVFATSYFVGAFAVDAAVSTADIASGTTFRDCSECPEMIVIPAGRFTMSRKVAADGRRDDDPEGVAKSAPAHEVKIDAPFALGINDVTRGEFRTFIRETGGQSALGCYIWSGHAWIEDKTKSWRNPGFRQSPRDPVVCVNWEDAQAYIQWMNSKLSKGTHVIGSPAGGHYRLPSWEEMEYAAGGGARTPYYWGPDANHENANYGADRCYPCRPVRRGRDRWLYTSPVGSFPPNAFGLYDMAGDVWQWTENCVRGSPTGLRWDPPALNEGCRSALHGGSWLVNPEYMRVGAYALNARINRNQTTGFRVARTLGHDIVDPPVTARFPSATMPESPNNADSQSAARLSARRFLDCPDCPEMVVIPAGSFTMGSSATGRGGDTTDLPEHRVRISTEFALGVYDVTRGQYGVFVRMTRRSAGKGCDVVDAQGRWVTDPGRNWRHPAYHQTDNDPVVCVSWQDAQAYVDWLNQRINSRSASTTRPRGPYRLPSEAEWEYAARAGSSSRYYWGDRATHNAANYGLDQCYPCGVEKSGRDRWYYTSPGGSFAPNAFGLYDMSGNVWQWIQDCMHYGYNGAPEDGSVWEGGECKLRVLRGGSWLDPGLLITVTLRNAWTPDSRNYANGFRVARSLP